MNIITILVEVLIFTSLIGVIFSLTNIDANSTNITGASFVLYGLIGLFVMVGFVVYLVKATGVKQGR